MELCKAHRTLQSYMEDSYLILHSDSNFISFVISENVHYLYFKMEKQFILLHHVVFHYKPNAIAKCNCKGMRNIILCKDIAYTCCRLNEAKKSWGWFEWKV